MNRLFTFLFIFLSLQLVNLPARAQNPFMSKQGPSKVSAAPAPPNPFIVKISAWQQRLNQKMAALIRETRETSSLRPLMPLILIVFMYGVLHAAGPGHGKAVATSFLLSRGRNLGEGILLSNMIAFFHGLSGAGLVLLLHFILNKGMMGRIEDITRMTQLISYSLIALLGAGMLVSSLFTWLRGAGTGVRGSDLNVEKKKKSLLAMALAVGMIPCPGVVLVMLFALSLNMIGLGLVLAFFQALGMAVTISLVSAVVITGKKLTIGTLENRRGLGERIEHVTETLAAMMVMALGLFFLVVML